MGVEGGGRGGEVRRAMEASTFTFAKHTYGTVIRETRQMQGGDDQGIDQGHNWHVQMVCSLRT